MTTRTDLMNNCFHLWLDRLAEALNDSGQSMGDGVLIKLPIKYTKENLKEQVVRPYMKAVYGKKSTTELSITQMQAIYQELDQIIAERSSVHVEWPSEESLSREGA